MSDLILPQKDVLIRHRRDNVQSYMAPGAQLRAPHFHYQSELFLTVDGTADFVVEGRPYTLKKGSVLFISNLERHYVLSSSVGFDRYTLRFSNEFFTSLLREPILLSVFKQRPENFSHLYQCSPEEFDRCLAHIQRAEQEYQQQKPYWALAISAQLCEILLEMYRSQPQFFPIDKSSERQSLIFRIQNYIDTHLQDDLRLETVADKFFINQYHLSHSFSRVTGYQFKSYIITARLSKAKDLLVHTDLEINQICAEVGFGSASHFISTFRQKEGLSPLQYRNRSRQKDLLPEV